jgi:hypothetical protein
MKGRNMERETYRKKGRKAGIFGGRNMGVGMGVDIVFTSILVVLHLCDW